MQFFVSLSPAKTNVLYKGKKPTGFAHVQQQLHSHNIAPKWHAERRKKEPRKVSYKLYVRRVLKEVHPGKEISMRALNIMNSFVIDALDRIATEATRMAHYDRRKTVTLRDMEFSCRLCLPDIMAKHANQKAQKTVTKFYAAKVRDRMRRTEMRRGEFAMMQMASDVSTLNFWTTADDTHHLYIVDDCSYIPRQIQLPSKQQKVVPIENEKTKVKGMKVAANEIDESESEIQQKWGQIVAREKHSAEKVDNLLA
ncbi:hypothetical protein niasHT_018504 [Heterodera trifolii]|uniref:Core Histone H2A/H2B/H3 domain-containing protein n=1 Tax=Heterodera trifolii TaxID=157864 RepID=A0ABD2LJA0_9BILA